MSDARFHVRRGGSWEANHAHIRHALFSSGPTGRWKQADTQCPQAHRRAMVPTQVLRSKHPDLEGDTS